MTALLLRDADLAEFAAATGDRNPLHTDPEFARVSPFGQPIAHGVLAAAAALAHSGADLARVTRLDIDFDLPVLPGLSYRVRAEPGRATLRLGETRVASIRWTSGAPPPEPEPESAGAAGPATGQAPEAGEQPRVLTAPEVARLAAESGRYQADLPRLHGLLRRLTGSSIPGRLAEPLAWASYFVGMRTPGRDALLASLQLTITAHASRPPGPVAYQARVANFDQRTGLVTVQARLARRAAADVTVLAFLRHRIEMSGPQHLSPLPRSERLGGRVVLAVGASRGLGAALACGLASQGATVLALSSRPAPGDLVQLARSGGLAVEWIRCDAADAAGLDAVVADRALDGLVLAAGPRVSGLPLSPDTVAASVAHVGEAVRLALTPLGVAAPALRQGAFVLFISSAAVTRSQPLWPHYVAAKTALEGLAGHTAQHHSRWRVAVARPPRLRTEMASGPASLLGALAPGLAAASIVTRLLDAPATPGQVQLIEGTAFPSATAAPAP